MIKSILINVLLFRSKPQSSLHNAFRTLSYLSPNSHHGESRVVSPTPPHLFTVPQLCIALFFCLGYDSPICLGTFRSSVKDLRKHSGISKPSNYAGIHRFPCTEDTTVSASNESPQTQRGCQKSTGHAETASSTQELTI